MSHDLVVKGTASVLRQQSPSSQNKRRLGEQAVPPVATPSLSPEQKSALMLAELRQTFAGELQQLRDQARRSGIADAEKENADDLQRLQETLQKKWRDKEQQLQTEFKREKERLGTLVEELHTISTGLEQQAQGVACELAFAMLTHLLGERAIQGLLIKDLAEQAIAQHKLAAPLMVKVARQDYERLQAALQDPGYLARFEADDRAQPGSCIVELEYGKVEASLDIQLAELKKRLLENLHNELPAKL